MNKWPAVLLSVVLGLVAAGCGGDDEDQELGGAGTTEQPADTGAGGGAAAGRTVQVGMQDIKYVPNAVRVKTGDTVRWTNSDSVTHTVTKKGGPGEKFDSGNMAVGAKYAQKFDTPGKVDYFCKIHPNQRGTVTVE